MAGQRKPWREALPGGRIVVALIAVALLVLGGSLLANVALDASLEELVNDPMATTGGHPLTGVLSHLGVLTWWAAASICLFAFGLMRRWSGDAELARLLFWGGALTAFLTFDDLFMFHEDLVRRHTPIPQPAAIGAVVLLVGLYVWRFRRSIRVGEWPLVVVAGILFAGSIGMDFLSDLGEVLEAWETPAVATFIEDWLKLSGILVWATYLIRSAAGALGAAARSPGALERDHDTD